MLAQETGFRLRRALNLGTRHTRSFSSQAPSLLIRRVYILSAAARSPGAGRCAASFLLIKPLLQLCVLRSCLQSPKRFFSTFPWSNQPILCLVMHLPVLLSGSLGFPCSLFALSSLYHAVLSDALEPSEDFKIHFCLTNPPSFHLHANVVSNTSPCATDPDFQVSNYCIFFVSFAALKETKSRPKCSFSCLQLFFCWRLPAGKNPRTVLMLYFQYQIHCYFRRKLIKVQIWNNLNLIYLVTEFWQSLLDLDYPVQREFSGILSSNFKGDQMPFFESNVLAADFHFVF